MPSPAYVYPLPARSVTSQLRCQLGLHPSSVVTSPQLKHFHPSCVPKADSYEAFHWGFASGCLIFVKL